jgi:hypothetical protein
MLCITATATEQDIPYSSKYILDTHHPGIVCVRSLRNQIERYYFLVKKKLGISVFKYGTSTLKVTEQEKK